MPLYEVLDLTGREFGRLTVLELEGFDGHRHAMWRCECSIDRGGCGAICVKRSNNLLNGTKSCGCLRRELGLAAIRRNSDLRGCTGAAHPMFGVRFKKRYSQAGPSNPHYKHGLRCRGVKRGLQRAWQKQQIAAPAK